MQQKYDFTANQIKKINEKCAEFYNLVLEHNNGEFLNFKNNYFLNHYENYKYQTIKDTRKLIEEIKLNKNFGSGYIRELLYESIKLGINLVNSFWRNNVKGILENLEGNKLKKFELNLHNLYCNLISEEDFFNYYVNDVGKVYSIIAYILFLKNSNKYLPIATKTFDLFFKDILLDFHTTSQCSWDNYCTYLNILNTIRNMLENQYGFKTTMIDTHSFIWVCEDPTWNPWKNKYKHENRVGKKYTEAVVKSRIGQGKFRERVIKKWGGKCSISNFSKTEFLIASHIKPWKDCNENECIDANNGLLLPPNIDFLFDEGNGYISFDDNGKIILSSRITSDIKKEFGITESIKLRKVDEKTKEYLAWHRKNVFTN